MAAAVTSSYTSGYEPSAYVELMPNSALDVAADLSSFLSTNKDNFFTRYVNGTHAAEIIEKKGIGSYTHITVRTIFSHPPKHIATVPFFNPEGMKKLIALQKARFGTECTVCKRDSLEEVAKGFKESTAICTTFILLSRSRDHYSAVTMRKAGEEVFAFQYDSLAFIRESDLTSIGVDGAHFKCNGEETQFDEESCSIHALSFAVQSQFQLGKMNDEEVKAFVAKKIAAYPEEWSPGVPRKSVMIEGSPESLVLDEITGETITLEEFRSRYNNEYMFRRQFFISFDDDTDVAHDMLLPKKWNEYFYLLGASLLQHFEESEEDSDRSDLSDALFKDIRSS